MRGTTGIAGAPPSGGPAPTHARRGSTRPSEPLDRHVSDGELVGLVERLAGALTDPDGLASLDTDGLRARVALCNRLEGAATAGLALAADGLRRAGGVDEDGAPSLGRWLATNTTRSARDAARMERLASRLSELPRTADALAAGEVGVEAADALVRAATDGRLGTPDEVEAALLPVATGAGPEELRRSIRRREQQVDGAALLRDERRQHALRRASLTRASDGMFDLNARLPGEWGEKAATLLDAFTTPDPPGTPPLDRRRPDQRLADAFGALIDAGLGHLDVPTTGGQTRPHLSVVVDLSTLDADLADDDGAGPIGPDDPAWGELPPGDAAWGTTLSPQAVRRICCDADVSRIVTDGTSQVLDAGRATRTWSPAQRRAVNVRDRQCRGPDCARPIGWTHIHHLRWWRHGGHTTVDNGLALCHHCHRLVHDLGWTVQLDPATAAATWTTPNRQRRIVTRPPPRPSPGSGRPSP